MLQDIAQLRRRIKDADGLLTVPMATLRDACGAQRLGTQIKAKIASALTEAGIASLPAQLPDYGDAEVRLLLVDGPIHATWRALSAPSAEGGGRPDSPATDPRRREHQGIGRSSPHRR